MERAGPIEAKLPEITAAFWVMKISATTLGETAGDLLSMTMKVGYALSSVILLSAFLSSLLLQLRAKRYYPPLYWLVIVTTSTAGTTLSDFGDRTLGLGYAVGSAILVTLLTIVLVTWRLSVGSLAIDRVRSRKAEVFYWVAVLVSNTLGTALGDFIADDSGLGFRGAALVVGGLLAIVLALRLLTKMSRVVLFWAAFVLTRPLGATVGDVLTKPHSAGGLALGTLGSSAVLLAVLVALVVREQLAAHPTPATPSR